MTTSFNGAVPLCFCRTEFLAAQQKVTAANLPDDFRHTTCKPSPGTMQMRMRASESTRPRGKDDSQEARTRNARSPSIDDRNHRLQYEYVLEDLRTLAQILS